MTAEIVVRRARAADMEAIVLLWEELVDFHTAHDPFFRRADGAGAVFAGFVAERLDADDARVLVAEVGGGLGGYLMAAVASYPPVFTATRYGSIFDLAVTASWRRRGVGARLVEAARAWFRQRGLTRAEVRVQTANPLSTAFWRKEGFTPYVEGCFSDL